MKWLPVVFVFFCLHGISAGDKSSTSSVSKQSTISVSFMQCKHYYAVFSDQSTDKTKNEQICKAKQMTYVKSENIANELIKKLQGKFPDIGSKHGVVCAKVGADVSEDMDGSMSEGWGSGGSSSTAGGGGEEFGASGSEAGGGAADDDEGGGGGPDNCASGKTSGWRTAKNGNRYTVVPGPSTSVSYSYDEAKKVCKCYGAKPASVHSDAENKFIFSLIEHLEPGCFWLGLRMDGTAGNWRASWEDGTPMNYADPNTNKGKYPWSSTGTQPTGYGKCVYTWNRDGGWPPGTWRDYPCESKGAWGFWGPIGVICEKLGAKAKATVKDADDFE